MGYDQRGLGDVMNFAWRLRAMGKTLLVDCKIIGAGGGTRTHDLGIMRPSLYP